MKNEIAKNNVTELVFILDRSGSMSGFEADVVGGFNATLASQREKEGTAYVSTVLFNNYSHVLHDRADIQEVNPLLKKDFTVGGCTALYDAVGDAIHHIGNVHKYARKEDVPAHTVFVITTDGQENASTRYSMADVKAMIQQKTEKFGWEFLFLAANIDAERAAQDIGIRKERAANYRQSPKGYKTSYRAMDMAISSLREERAKDLNLATMVKEEEQKG